MDSPARAAAGRRAAPSRRRGWCPAAAGLAGGCSGMGRRNVHGECEVECSLCARHDKPNAPRVKERQPGCMLGTWHTIRAKRHYAHAKRHYAHAGSAPSAHTHISDGRPPTHVTPCQLPPHGSEPSVQLDSTLSLLLKVDLKSRRSCASDWPSVGTASHTARSSRGRAGRAQAGAATIAHMTWQPAGAQGCVD